MGPRVKYAADYYRRHRKIIADKARARRLALTEPQREAKRLYQRSWYASHRMAKCLQKAAARARKKGLSCSIKAIDLTIPKRCPITGRPFGKPNTWDAMSIDRRNNSKGYVPGNVFIVSRRGNAWKNEMSITDVRRLLRYMEGSNVSNT